MSLRVSIEEKGKQIYKQNQHFRRLAHIMEHPEFREFYDEYMKDWDSTKTIIMFMKIYEAIEKHSDVQLSPYQKIAVVKDVVDDGELRHKICQGINEWSRGKEPFISLLGNKHHSYIESSTPSKD